MARDLDQCTSTPKQLLVGDWVVYMQHLPSWKLRVVPFVIDGNTPPCRCPGVLQESHRALMTKDLMNSGLLRDRYVADLFERLQVGNSVLNRSVLDMVHVHSRKPHPRHKLCIMPLVSR